MERQLFRFATAAILFLLVAGCQRDDATGPAALSSGGPRLNASASAVAADRTPLQLALMATIARREAQGLPVPAVTFEYEQLSVSLLAVGAGVPPVVAKTVLHFDGPAQAGHDKWPDLVVRNNGSASLPGFINEGDYTQFVREKTAERLPGVWDVYEFGYQPRTYTITETITETSPDVNSIGLAAVNTADEFLMGLTIPGPNLDYSITFDVEECLGDLCATIVDFFAGFKLDWTLGLRLPMNVSFTSSEPLLEGSTYFPTSRVNGLNWSAANYSAAGVPPEDGNEYITRFVFKFGVFLEVFGADVIDLGPNIDLNRTKDFATPFGPGATFALPDIDLTLWDFDAAVASASIGFRLTPHAGSDKFTANWSASGASGEASGDGSLNYSSPDISAIVGPLNAIDGPGSADVRLDAMRYFFTQFLLDLGLFFHLDVFGIVDETFVVPITDFDLSALTADLSVGTHAGTPSAFNASVAISNVAPTAEIDRTGTVVINGIQTFLGQPGSFTGTARDPGRDDLTLRWDWDDGAPAPDVTTTHPVPHEVTETQSHSFDATCLYRVGFSAEDDDQAMAQDQVPVLFVSNASLVASRMEGYWQHQLHGVGDTDFSEATLGCYLKVVDFASLVFSERRSIATIADAHDVLFLKQNQATEQLDRELLVAWLNFANGTFGYNELVDANADGVDETPFASAMAGAEAVRLNPAATTAEIKDATTRVHNINASRVGSSD